MNQSTTINANNQYIKMTETPVAKLILSLGIPTTISMLITNIYNMADSYFVSQVSLSAGGATSIVFGIMSILQAFGFMFGHGAGSNISRMLGSKQIEKASRYASTGFLGALLCGLVFIPLCIILPQFLGITGIELAQSLAYFTAAIISLPMMLAFLKQLPNDPDFGNS